MENTEFNTMLVDVVTKDANSIIKKFWAGYMNYHEFISDISSKILFLEENMDKIESFDKYLTIKKLIASYTHICYTQSSINAFAFN